MRAGQSRLALAGVIVFSALFGAAIALNMRHGMAIYAERLISGLAGCF
ncbi:hypothetical protein HDIA_0279 [Hartmannibacter diazotrophicus]|uniref:Uncharacterized protein n=1 Tax=Hartmannibacter diazotrophicus TaxID=1482074 RepID=A0A2C9D0N9_9HYPH|nr:hypothetical protein [Hartmannibacter diazotrophicus]SON53820.1 hypothetical protein HDIA_0279 [Hartmannibacter diazotrophicus]